LASIPDEYLPNGEAAGRAQHVNLMRPRAMGLPENTFRNRLLRAAQRGLDGTGLGGAVPLGQVIKGTSTLYDSEGTPVLQWVKTGFRTVTGRYIGAMKEALAGFDGFAKPVAAPKAAMAELCTLTPLGDLHVGYVRLGRRRRRQLGFEAG
jgi:hypothetical protein